MKNGARASILSFLLLTLPGICADFDSASASASPQTSSLRIPAQAHNRKNPVPDIPGAVKAGGDLFASQCAMCHGVDGGGRGDVAVSLKMKVPDLRTTSLQKKRTDGDLFYLTKMGHGDMPAEKRLSEQNLWEIIRFIRSLEKKPSESKSHD